MPLNLQTTMNANIAPPPPSALATARHIEDINCITYPQGIKSPRLELNVNTQKGKFRYDFESLIIVPLFLNMILHSYDRDFLLQFMNICKEKPDNLPPLDVIGLEPTGTSNTMSRGDSGRNRNPNGLSMPPNTRSASIGLGFISSPMASKRAGSGFQMGQYSTSVGKLSSEERFTASSGCSVSVTGDPLGGRPPTMVRTISQSGTGRKRTRSKRGKAPTTIAQVHETVSPSRRF